MPPSSSYFQGYRSFGVDGRLLGANPDKAAASNTEALQNLLDIGGVVTLTDPVLPVL